MPIKKSDSTSAKASHKLENHEHHKNSSNNKPTEHNPLNELIDRPLYTETLRRYLNTPEIKVLIGVRRCGKSSLLSLLSKHLKKEVPEQNIIHIKLDSYETPLDADIHWLNSQINAQLKKSTPNSSTYILLDEVQEIEGWEKLIRKLNTRKNTDIFITGSNSRVLSGDLATFLAGRYIEIPIYPLNFSEYETFGNTCGWNTENKSVIFDDFLTYGGMPGIFYYGQGNKEAYSKLLSGITDTVVLKDVIERNKIKDAALLNRLIKYIFSTSGNLLSTKRIVDALNSTGRKSSQETIDNYIKALISSKVLSRVSQAGIAGREILREKCKYYVVDTGLRNMSIGFNTTRDLGFQFEGLIHNELRTRGWSLSALRNKQNEEIDFACTRDNKKIYLQCSLSILNEKTYFREIRPLRSLNDSFPKYVITKDRARNGINEDGIHIVNVIDFLDRLESGDYFARN